MGKRVFFLAGYAALEAIHVIARRRRNTAPDRLVLETLIRLSRDLTGREKGNSLCRQTADNSGCGLNTRRGGIEFTAQKFSNS